MHDAAALPATYGVLSTHFPSFLSLATCVRTLAAAALLLLMLADCVRREREKIQLAPKASQTFKKRGSRRREERGSWRGEIELLASFSSSVLYSSWQMM